MATVGVLNTTDLTFFLDDVAVACATDCSLSVSDSMREILCKDTDGWKSFLPGIKEFSGSGSGLFALDAPAGSGGVFMMDTLIAGTKLVAKFGTEETGDAYYTGDVYVQASEQSSSGAGENAGYSFTLRGTGALSKSVNT